MSSKSIFPVRAIIANRIIEPKNILLNTTTQLLSLFNIAFFAMVFSIAQRIVAPRTSMSPILISAESFDSCIKRSPNSIMSMAISCFFPILSLRKMKARIVAYIGRVLCRNAALPAIVNLSPVKNNQKAMLPPNTPIRRRYFHETFLNFFFVDFEMYRDMKKKMIPMKRALVAVNISGSMLTTKNLLMTMAAPEITAVIRIRIVPHNSFEFLFCCIISIGVIMYLKFPSMIKYESFSFWEPVFGE